MQDFEGVGFGCYLGLRYSYLDLLNSIGDVHVKKASFIQLLSLIGDPYLLGL